MLCRYCNKNVESYPIGYQTAFLERWGYQEGSRICGCGGIDPLNQDISAKKEWVEYNNKGWIIDVFPVKPVKDWEIQRGASFSDDNIYRYTLHRIWDSTLAKILFIMINPSTASDRQDDKTIKKIIEISKRWAYGGLYVGNIYPYCSSKPAELKGIKIPDEIHKENIKHIEDMVSKCATVVYAWGTKGPNEQQKEPEWLRNIVKKNVHCINISVKGIPMHPNQWGPNVQHIPNKPILYRSIL